MPLQVANSAMKHEFTFVMSPKTVIGVIDFDGPTEQLFSRLHLFEI